VRKQHVLVVMLSLSLGLYASFRIPQGPIRPQSRRSGVRTGERERAHPVGALLTEGASAGGEGGAGRRNVVNEPEIAGRDG